MDQRAKSQQKERATYYSNTERVENKVTPRTSKKRVAASKERSKTLQKQYSSQQKI